MKEAKLTSQGTKILELLKAERKEMNFSQISSAVEMDKELTLINLNNLEKGGYVTGKFKEENEEDKPFLIRYFSITEKGLTYPTD